MSTNPKILQPSGILNAISGNQLRREINDHIAAGDKLFLIDLEAVEFIDSSGLGALVSSMQNIKASGGEMCVCSIGEQVKMLFELTKMNKIFKIFANQQEFHDSFVATEK
ncbi:STAS domain-containing protein [Calothrix sp. 336/3]|uniref:STAS domain-containing protein n=1 Tax=Calothrix sp. 336/3 TaxID=1337936 RepID=UPI0004E36380|nr:STAS domain-containing protein [Calothrix sp. 336/3]AKG22444.1 sulfate transporter [Calothrix sp. 336/3]